MIFRRPRTLLWQLGSAVIALQILLIVALGWFGYAQLTQFHFEQKLLELDRLTRVLEEPYRRALNELPENAFNTRVKEDGRRTQSRITVILRDGRVIADSHHDPALMDDHGNRPEVIGAIATGRGSASRFSHTMGVDLLYLARPMDTGSDIEAVVRTAQPLQAIDGQLTELLKAVGIAGVISLLMTSLTVYFISQRLSHAVSRVADDATRFASGDLDHRVDNPASLEMGRLATALNEMARQLSRQILMLQRQRGEREAILQSMGNGVIALDPQQHILSINRAAEKMLGVESNSSTGRLLQEAIREPELNKFVGEALTGSRSRSMEITLEHNELRCIEATSETLTDDGQQRVGLLVILNDVTELRKLESVRSDFASNVSHELRTPITNIKGYVETLMDVGWNDHDQTGKYLDVIRKNGDRLAAIVEDILALTRLEQPRMRDILEREPRELQSLVQAVLSQSEPTAAAKGMTLRNTVPPDIQVRVQGQLLEQAIGNLVGNAVNYGPPDSTITVSAREASTASGTEVEISVADEGPGIAAEHLSRLFERFYRVDKARSRELGGTGLGLAIVKHVTLAHGGRVDVQSETGKGSVFRIFLPGM